MAVAVNIDPDPKLVLVPHAVPCQYHVSPEGGVPERVIVTLPLCGELLVGVPGFDGGVQFTVTLTLPQLEDQQPAEFFERI